jgi:hypothetical protein
MTTRTVLPVFLGIPLLLSSLAGCQPQDGLTADEAAQAKDEMQIGTASQALTSKSVEITTHFTIGGAVEQAADELRQFYQSQWACADVQLSGHTLTVEYGAHGVCPFNSYQQITGTHTVTITKNDASEVIVDHQWTNLSNGVVEVSGTAHVTWNKTDPSRRVQHDLTWTRIADGRTGEGTGDIVQKPLANGGIAEGFTEDGSRSWTGRRGHWDLAIDQLELHWEDPLPRAGSLTLETPFDKTVSMSFALVRTGTIRVTLVGPRGGTFSFNVTTSG